jgi:hypothetical protein
MPNWCNNTLKVTGSPKEVQRFREIAEPLSMARLLPIPEELKCIHSSGSPSGITHNTDENGHIVVNFAGVDVWEHARCRTVGEKDIPLSYEEQKALLEKYGARDCREWVVKNWGTKWDFHDCKIEGSADMVVYCFGTAYGPPILVIEKMAELYPNLSFLLSFGSREIQSYGSILFLMGYRMLWKELGYLHDIYDEPQRFCKEFSSSLHKEFPEIYGDPKRADNEQCE